MKRIVWGVGLLAVIAVGIGLWRAQANRPPLVTVAEVVERPLEATFTAEGWVRGRTYDLAAEQAGRVVWIGTREGDAVRAGQAVIRLDGADLDAAIRQAEAEVRTAESAIPEAQAAVRATDSQVRGRILAAQARVREAEARLTRVRRGAREPEIEQARQRLRQTEAALADAKTRLDRARRLFEEGAISRAQFEAVETEVKLAEALRDESRAALDLVLSGPLPEDVRMAEAAVESARAELRAAETGRDEVAVRQRALEGARSRVGVAKAALARLHESRRHLEIRSPVDGTVTRLAIEKGAALVPGATAMVVSTREDLYVEAEVASEDLMGVAEGLAVEITSAAYPGRTFAAHLERLSPVGELKPDAAIRTRIVRARIRLDEGGETFRPGVEVDVQGKRGIGKVVLAPSDGLVAVGDRVSAFVLDGEQVRQREVRAGFADSQGTEILAGLKAGDRVVVRGKDGLVDGARVRLR